MTAAGACLFTPLIVVDGLSSDAARLVDDGAFVDTSVDRRDTFVVAVVVGGAVSVVIDCCS
jgi:hypothetical protein